MSERTTPKRLLVDSPDSAIVAAYRMIGLSDRPIGTHVHSAHRTALVGIAVLYLESKVDFDGRENLTDTEDMLYGIVNREEEKAPGMLARVYRKYPAYLDTVLRVQAGQYSRALRRDERLLLILHDAYKLLLKQMECVPYRFTVRTGEK